MVDVVRSGACAPTRGSFSLSQLLWAREAGVFLALLALCLFLTFATGGFLTSLNLLNVGRQISLLGIMAVGMTFVLIAGEVDLSVGSTYAFCGLASGMLICAGWPLFAAVGLGVVAGCIIGLINGLLSTYGRLPSLIATLGMLSMVRGAALILTGGQPVTVNVRNGASESVLTAFEFMGQGYLFGVVPMQLVFFVIVAAIAWFILSMTNFGFRIFAVGGSAKAARVSGIHVNAVKIWAFILMGALGLELDVIAATIVGGASLSGGEGTILGTILGVLIIGVMRNGLVLMGVSPFVQEFMIGLVIVIAVGIDKWSTRRTA
jgi:ribose transport system permease protein